VPFKFNLRRYTGGAGRGARAELRGLCGLRAELLPERFVIAADSVDSAGDVMFAGV
jgi:hypothetical protein